MKNSKSILNSKPPTVAKAIIYIAGLVVLLTSFITLVSMDVVVEGWYAAAYGGAF